MANDENNIIRIYGKRWDIEVFFKVCKSCLKFFLYFSDEKIDELVDVFMNMLPPLLKTQLQAA